MVVLSLSSLLFCNNVVARIAYTVKVVIIVGVLIVLSVLTALLNVVIHVVVTIATALLVVRCSRR